MIHVLGAGAMGLLYASKLSEKTILVRKSVCPSAFKVQRVDDDAKIANLLIATKAHQTTAAISLVISRLDSFSNLILLQNGLLKSSHVLREYLTKHSINPNIILVSTTHGVTRTGQFSFYHAGRGSTILGTLNYPTARDMKLMQYLQQEWSDLSTKIVSPQDLQTQLRLKLGINACINPVTALLRCKNGALLDSPAKLVVQNLANEASKALGIEKLHEQVEQVIQKTSNNKSSMLVDVLNERETEIDYLNGHLIQIASEKGISTPTHMIMHQLIKSIKYF
jgi:2-dehydropantoate 2-reductase